MMNCDDAGMLLQDALDHPDDPVPRRVLKHLESCEDCRAARRAVAYLREERDRPIPGPRPGALGRALRAASHSTADRRRRAGGFRAGLAVGAAAAGIVAAAAMLVLSRGLPGSSGPPEITMALHEPGEVSIAIDAPRSLRNAEIHVRLRGAVDLVGFEGQRDIQWMTDLEQGINELTLPVVAIGEQGGQVLVVVHHDQKRKTFLVDVHAG